MKTQVQLILATFAMTVLIWVYADLTSQESYEVTLTMRLSVPPGSESVIRAEGAPIGTDTGFDTSAMVPVQATLMGPKAAIADIEHLRRTEGLVIDVPVVIGQTGGPEVIRTVDIREHIARWGRAHSLRIVDLSRQLVEYRLDHYVRVTLTLEGDVSGLSEKLRGSPRFEPPQVEARLLASQRDLVGNGERKLEVPLDEELRGTDEDAFEKSLAGLRWHGLDVTYIPDRVEVTVQRRGRFETVQITPIPMYELWPAYKSEQGQFRVEWEDGEAPLQKIQVEVPASALRMPTNTDVIAYVKIEPEDLKQASQDVKVTDTAPAGTRAGILREVRFIFAEGFEDVRIVGERPTVRFRVVRVDLPGLVP